MDSSPPKSHLYERRAFLLVFSTFAFFGVAFGTWLVLLAELQAAFSLSPALLGSLLASGLLLSLSVMTLGGRAVDRWGPGVVIAGSAGTIGAALVGTVFAPTYALRLPEYSRYHRIIRNAEKLWAALALELVRSLPEAEFKIVDAKPLPVAKRKRAETCKGLGASKGFATMEMVYGFKLHALVNEQGLFSGVLPRLSIIKRLLSPNLPKT